jgi:hypothetical protein
MFTVYAEKDIFENFILFNEQAPVWYNIFCNHSHICLNITDEELNSEEVQGTIIFEFILANGGKSPIALADYFETIYEDNHVIAEKPRSVFFLNYTKNEADDIQASTGVLVHGMDYIEDCPLKGSFFKNLPKDAVFEGQNKKGWQHLVNFPLPPSNAMVITDEYLFSNEENGHNVGKVNVIQLVDAFLPEKLNVPYHVTIIANDNIERKTAKSVAWCERMASELKQAIVALRKYPIVFELVFTETIHRRKLIQNYINVTTDKGFAVFSPNDGKTVKDDNDFRCDHVFTRILSHEGDTDFVTVEGILQELKKKCDSVKEFITNAGQTASYRILGDCRTDFAIQNRLINDA